MLSVSKSIFHLKKYPKMSTQHVEMREGFCVFKYKLQSITLYNKATHCCFAPCSLLLDTIMSSSAEPSLCSSCDHSCYISTRGWNWSTDGMKTSHVVWTKHSSQTSSVLHFLFLKTHAVCRHWYFHNTFRNLIKSWHSNNGGFILERLLSWSDGKVKLIVKVTLPM